MRRLLDRYPERVLIGEIYLPLERLVSYYGADTSGEMRGAHLPFNFQLLSAPWDARQLAACEPAAQAVRVEGGPRVRRAVCTGGCRN